MGPVSKRVGWGGDRMLGGLSGVGDRGMIGEWVELGVMGAGGKG